MQERNSTGNIHTDMVVFVSFSKRTLCHGFSGLLKGVFFSQRLALCLQFGTTRGPFLDSLFFSFRELLSVCRATEQPPFNELLGPHSGPHGTEAPVRPRGLERAADVCWPSRGRVPFFSFHVGLKLDDR